MQICHEFERFSVYMTSVKVANFYGGIPIKQNKEQLESEPPHVVVGTPGRIKQACPSPFACVSVFPTASSRRLTAP